MSNKKGLSTVVTTLIIILLVLVAVGIIWGVVNNLLTKSKGKIESSAECFDLDVHAVKVSDDTSDGGDNDYNVFLERSAGGSDSAIYAKVSFVNAGGESDLEDFDVGLLQLETKNKSFTDVGVVNATKIKVTPYYLDESGAEKLCPITTEYEFSFY